MRLNEMVSGWMTDNPVTIAQDRPVMEAYALMAQNGVRHLPVVKDGRLVGIVSDRDLHRAAPLWKAHKPLGAEHLVTPVSEIMTRERILTVNPMSTLAEAARIIAREKVNSVLVLDGDRLVGILTSHDLVRAVIEFYHGSEDAPESAPEPELAAPGSA